MLTHSDILHSDATVSNINGKRKAVILCTDKEQVLYQHLDHKGHVGLSPTPVKDFKGTIVHDHDKSYYSYGSSHQECIAHKFRYLVGAIENEPNLKWHKQMHDLLQKMIHIAKKNKTGIPNEQVNKRYYSHFPRYGIFHIKSLRPYKNAKKPEKIKLFRHFLLQ